MQEFKEVLEFFQTQDKDSFIPLFDSNSAGGKHIDLAFENGNKIYNYAVICDCLTDCTTIGKWIQYIPSAEKKFLTIDDLYYDSKNKTWDLSYRIIV